MYIYGVRNYWIVGGNLILDYKQASMISNWTYLK